MKKLFRDKNFKYKLLNSIFKLIKNTQLLYNKNMRFYFNPFNLSKKKSK